VAGLTRAPILVTGMHRSGTSWVGRMLSASREAVYLHEPLNPVRALTLLRQPLPIQYLYVTSENEGEYIDAFRRLLTFPLDSARLEQGVPQKLRRTARLLHARLTGARALLKDPFAVFSVPWFVQRLGADVVVVVRRPLALVGSTKRLNWGFDTTSLLRQPLLLRDRLGPFRADLEAQPTTIVGQAALLWRLVYGVVGDYERELPRIRIVRHEDLSLDPLGGFEQLYEQLGLSFSARARRAIERTTNPVNPKETPVDDPGAIALDSRANLETWRQRLTADEVELVRRETDEVARAFYA
jgi:hypothetical protein